MRRGRRASGFRDRADAGRVLAAELSRFAGRDDVVVLALPRGGVPVAVEIARRLGAPLDVFVVRKLGVPGHEELALGAIATGGVRIINEPVVARLGITTAEIDAIAAREQEELERRERSYRGRRPRLDPGGKTVILVDDGLATGSTMRAAVAALEPLEPARVVVAVPVAPRSACDALAADVSEVVCALVPADMTAISAWYRDFTQTSDEEVTAMLEDAGGPAGPL